MEEFTITLYARTPLWTGGVSGIPDRLHETGLIGSLRWWYEAIVRGFGHFACDPIGGKGCRYDPKKSAPPEEQLCPACYVFGATGWKRRFRLEILGVSQQVPFGLLTLDEPRDMNHWWLSQVFEKSLKAKLSSGRVDLRIVSKSEVISQQIKAIFALLHEAGAIGAKPQYGFGQVHWQDASKSTEILSHVETFLAGHPGKRAENNHPRHVSLTDMWVYNLEIPNDHSLVRNWITQGNWVGQSSDTDRYLPVSFDIRFRLPNDDEVLGLRKAYREATDRQSTRNIFGYMQGENRKQRSLVFVSHLYKDDVAAPYRLRVWGFTHSGDASRIGQILSEMFAFPSIQMTRFQAQSPYWMNKPVPRGKEG